MSKAAESASPPAYRIDRFAVPEAARAEFLERVHATHDLLRSQPGFVQDFLVEQTADDGASIILTMVEWESEDAIEAARKTVGAIHRRMNFVPRELIARLRIKAELGYYRPLVG
jgi:heme-degrading monooxygenase HmoA